MAEQSDTTPLLALQGITKQYPGTLANDVISLSIFGGEIHALLGENGAGKSTLVQIIHGVTEPDSGTLAWLGDPTALDGGPAARREKIGMVFQHFTLFESLTAAENVALGLHETDVGSVRDRLRAVSETYGIEIDPDRKVSTLAAGERQRIEIARCILQNPDLLILDEPTSVLTPQEVDGLFRLLERLAQEGHAILYISHKLWEIRRVCRTATILRRGRVVATCDPRVTEEQEIARLMLGDVPMPDSGRSSSAPGDVRLSVTIPHRAADGPLGTPLEDIRLDVRAGEIVGIAGIAGNGQAELASALSGATPTEPKDGIRIDGAPAGALPLEARRAMGLGFVPEDRRGEASVHDFALFDNAMIGADVRANLVRLGLVDRGARDGFAGRIVAGFDVRTPGIEHTAGSLSGGNLQKFIIGRELLLEPMVLIVEQPTQGVDAGAAAAIHDVLRARAANGAAVLVLSQDLDELMGLSDRVAVLSAGRLSEALDPRTTALETFGKLMLGSHQEAAAHDALTASAEEG